MNLPPWGMLPKSQIDPEKIEEAIDRKTRSHNEDPESHLLPGQSLQSHKMSEIIDHRAESVVNDKIQSIARAYVAIVDIAGNGDFTDIQTAIEYVDTKDGGIVYIKRGHYLPPANIQLKKSVDLIGDGPKETVINFQGLNRGIRGYEIFRMRLWTYSGCSWTSGSNIVTFPAGTRLLDDRIRRGMMITDMDGWGFLLYIQSVDSQTQLTLTTAYTGPTHVGRAQIRLVATWTNGSRIVTFPAGTLLITDGVKAGMEIIEQSEHAQPIEIVSVDSETQLTIRDPYPLTTGLKEAEIREKKQPHNIISDLEIRNSQATYAVDAPSSDAAVRIERVHFRNCRGLVNAITAEEDGIIRECYFINNTGPTLFHLQGYIIENNYGHVPGADIVAFSLFGKILVTNNQILFDHPYGASLFFFRGGAAIVTGNEFVFCQIFDKNTATRSAFKIANNNFRMPTNAHFEFRHLSSNIIGNRFILSGLGRFRFLSVSDRNTLAGNLITTSIEDAGTRNDIAHNIEG